MQIKEIQFLVPDCPGCGKSHDPLTLDFDKFMRWHILGAFIQDVWPEKSPGERERMRSGYHEECWDKVFGEEQ